VTPEASFLAEARRLPPNRKQAVITALDKFRKEPALPSLKFRPLEGHRGYFIINAVHGDRIILRKDADDLFAAVDVGPHDNVYRRWDRRP
jgi:hypothetical protein